VRERGGIRAATRNDVGRVSVPVGVVACVFALSEAHAEAPLAINWSAPPNCARIARVRQDVAELAGPNAGAGARATLVVTEAAGAWRAQLTLSGTVQGQRSLSADSCDAAARAAALVIALAVNPEAASRLSEKLLAPVAAEPPPPAPAAEEPAPPAPEPPLPVLPNGRLPEVVLGDPPVRYIDRSPRLEFGAGATGEFGLLPEFSFGVAAAAGLKADWFRTELELALFPSRYTSYRAAPNFGGRFAMGSLSLRTCARLLDHEVSAHLCGALRGHQLRAEGEATSEVGEDERARFATFKRNAAPASATLGGLFAWPSRSWIALQTRAEAVFPLSRPEFVIEGLGRVHRPEAVGVTALLGVLVTPGVRIRFTQRSERP
jgi:hypothetical protein